MYIYHLLKYYTFTSLLCLFVSVSRNFVFFVYVSQIPKRETGAYLLYE